MDPGQELHALAAVAEIVADFVKTNYGKDTGTKDTWKQALKVWAIACQRNNALPAFIAHCYKTGEEYKRAVEVYTGLYDMSFAQRNKDIKALTYLAYEAGETFTLLNDLDKAAVWYQRSADYLGQKEGANDYYANQSFEKVRELKKRK